MNPPPQTPDIPPAPRPPSSPVVASILQDPDGRPRLFRLSHGPESTALEPGHTWLQVDRHKWATRGLIEAPQSFAVHADGSVDYNGETFRPGEAGHTEALTTRLNKQHTPALPAAHAAGTPAPAHSNHPAPPPTGQVAFHVHLDPMGHPVIEAHRDGEHTATGLRGLSHLARDGWMRPPELLHVDPLQRYVELDGQRFTADATGARDLEEALNARYRPATAARGNVAIQVRESAAASTGFDIHFQVIRAGTRVDIQGHLGQDKLDLLQDTEKCGILKPGIILRLSPPNLYFRRRRADGGEESIPGIPDIKYRGITASELQRILNHPLLRADAGVTETAAEPPVATPTPPPPGPKPSTLATTPPVRPADAPEAPAAPPRAPVAPAPTSPASPPTPTSGPPRARPPEAATPERDPSLAALFAVTEPRRIHREVFRQLSDRLHLPAQDVLFSLPRVFEDREFEILSFDGAEIQSVLELRGGRFFGVYLTHLAGDRTDLVYACQGVHIEWGTGSCAIQPGPGAETLERKGAGLLGLAQNADHHFVFIVTPEAREFARRHEHSCAAAFAHFVTVEEWAAQRSALPLIWPLPAADAATAPSPA